MGMQPQRHLLVALLGVMLLGANPAVIPPAAAGGFGKALLNRVLKGGASRPVAKSAKPVTQEVLKRDLVRDAATPAKPLAAPRTVHRYTTAAQAEREAKHGLKPDRHMTANAPRGRPLTADHAQGRYGTPTRPEVRETIVLPKGYPVRHNKALRGEPGRGELTSSQPLPPDAIRRVVPVPR